MPNTLHHAFKIDLCESFFCFVLFFLLELDPRKKLNAPEGLKASEKTKLY